MSRLTLVTLGFASRDAAFDPIRAAGVEVVHADFAVDWSVIGARRAGTPAAQEPPVSPATRAALARADALFAFAVPAGLPALAPRLRWIETPATGIDHLRGTGVLESPITVTSVGGLFAHVIAEHVWAGILWCAKRLGTFAAQQREHRWQTQRVQTIAGRTLALVGVGAIGSAVGMRAQAFGARVLGIGRGDTTGRHVRGVDEVWPRRRLHALLGIADWVVLAVAETAETRGMIGASELAAMRADAVLVNVARGTIVDEAALVDALRDGRLGGAALDVFADEPLAPASPLWELPNVLVTPHIATNVPEYLPGAIEHLAANVRRFLVGEPLDHLYDRARGY